MSLRVLFATIFLMMVSAAPTEAAWDTLRIKVVIIDCRPANACQSEERCCNLISPKTEEVDNSQDEPETEEGLEISLAGETT